MHDDQIEEYLNSMLFRAIAAFRYPNIPLTYTTVDEGYGDEYAFENDVTQKEINVLLALVKFYWLEQQLDTENRFEDLYYDRDVKTYSRGNMLKEMKDRYKLAKADADEAQYEYSRVTNGAPTLGTLYE
jgi:pyruvate/2-oxoacid:ferredoxin oxidoreductase beta subunit